MWRNFGRMFALVEQHSKDMQKHGNDLAELRERVTKLETKQRSTTSLEGGLPTPPPAWPEPS
eukprot:934536-Amphidinium_carterae.1